MPRHLALPGHLLIYGVYPELKRLRRTPAVVGWRPSEDASRDATSRPPASRRAPSIFHCLEGSSVVAITSRDRPCSCYSADGFWIFTTKTPKSRTFGDDRRRSSRKKAPSRFFLVGARALFRAFRSQKAFPLVSPPQLKKQNDKESARDMTGYKPSNFDKGFREGKGWGDLVRRLGKQ